MCGQFRAIRKSDSERMFCNTYIFINSTLLFYRNWKQNQKNLPNTALILLLCVKVLISETTYVCTYVPNFNFLA